MSEKSGPGKNKGKKGPARDKKSDGRRAGGSYVGHHREEALGR